MPTSKYHRDELGFEQPIIRVQREQVLLPLTLTRSYIPGPSVSGVE